MKRLLFIACLLFFSCSASDDTEEEQQNQTSEYLIFVMNGCPDHTSSGYYMVSRETHEEIMEQIAVGSEYCVAVDFKTIHGTDISGWYGGESSP